MIDKEKYKRELVRMWDTLRDDKYKGIESCSGVNDCGGCPLNNIKCGESSKAFEMIEAVEKWSREHPEKKYKISRIENEVLTSEFKHLRQSLTLKEKVFDNYTFAFSASRLLSKLLKLGYYEGANLDTSIDDYLSKSVVIK